MILIGDEAGKEAVAWVDLPVNASDLLIARVRRSGLDLVVVVVAAVDDCDAGFAGGAAADFCDFFFEVTSRVEPADVSGPRACAAKASILAWRLSWTSFRYTS